MRKNILPLALLMAALYGHGLAQTAVVMQSADAKTLDPTMNRETPTFNVLLNIFDGLLFKEPDGSFSPALAESWQAVDDTTWEFDLRDGVSFHNGEPFTAEAVRFTIERILDPEVESPIRRGFSFISEVEVVDADTVRISTAAPQPLAENYFSELLIVPPEYYQEAGAEEFGRAPVGTGPFRFVSWKRDVALRLAANQEHWRGAPDIAGLTFRPVPEAVTRFSSLAAGEADLVTQVPPSLVSTIQATPGARLETVESARVIYVGINTESGNEALQDERVRQALNYVVDLEGIVQGIFGGLAVPTTTLLTEIDFGHNPDLQSYPHDPERARELLEEAGYADGLTLTMGTPSGRYVNDVQVAQAIEAQLEDVGVTVDLQVREYGSYVGQLFSGDAPDLYLIGWGNAPFDADFILYPLLHGEGILSYYGNPELDELLDRAHTTIDREVRREAYEDATELIQEEAPVIFLYKQVDAYGLSERLEWEPRPDEFLWLHGASLR
jgi:peptide/nickel transport system substrate-binding protein